MTTTLGAPAATTGPGTVPVADLLAAPALPSRGKDRRWLGLLLLSASEFMVVLDASIVNIAMPRIGAGLHLSGSGLAWIITAYVVAFGALLPLGGRVADLLGRRRMFLVGAAVFSVASLVAGFAGDAALLIAARAAQGVGAAMLAPAATALVTDMYPEPGERSKALSVWGAVAGAGGTAGVLLGGLLTGGFGWRSIFLVNVPIGLAVLIAVPLVIRTGLRSATTRLRVDDFDLPGALLVTTSLVALVTALSEGQTWGWGSASIVSLFVTAAVLMIGFVAVERRVRSPLVPLRLFRVRTVSAGNAVLMLTSAAMAGLFYFLSLYEQDVLRYGVVASGISQLPVAIALGIGATIAAPLMSRLGSRVVVTAALLVFSAGMALFALAPVDGTFLADILGPSILVGIGLGAVFVAGTAVAVTGVPEHDSGVAGGLINASRQVGVAIGIAALAALALHHTDALSGAPSNDVASALTSRNALAALADGYSWAFYASAAIALVAAVVSAAGLRRHDAISPAQA